MLWASKRIEVIKKHLVKASLPPGWRDEKTLADIAGQDRYLHLQAMKDKDDIHVAAAAGYLAHRLGRSVILVSTNLDDLPQDLLSPMTVIAMHPGTLLELLYGSDPGAVAGSLLRTSQDFKNPAIPPEKMLLSIASPNQFDNPTLAGNLAKDWGLA